MKKTWSLHVGGSFPTCRTTPSIRTSRTSSTTASREAAAAAPALLRRGRRAPPADGGLPRQGIARPDFVPPPATGAVFADVPAAIPSRPGSRSCRGAGITGGCSAPPPPALPSFCPTATVNRQQMAAFLGKAYWGSSLSGWNSSVSSTTSPAPIPLLPTSNTSRVPGRCRLLGEPAPLLPDQRRPCASRWRSFS